MTFKYKLNLSPEERERRRQKMVQINEHHPNRRRRMKGAAWLKDHDSALGRLVYEVASKYDLSENQAIFLMKRASTSTDKQAGLDAGVSPLTVAMWKAGNVPSAGRFPEAYADYLAGLAGIADEQMQVLLLKTVKRTDELLDATRQTDLGPEPDQRARAKGIEFVWRWVGKWSEKQEHTEDPRYVQVMDRFNSYLEGVSRGAVDGEYTELRQLTDGTDEDDD